MTKHTQGKWEIMPRENLPPRIKSKSFGIICRLNDIFPTEHGYQENEANARLIAAAPELLEALEAILSPLVNNNHDGMELWKSDDQYHNAVAAIAKTKGE